MEIDQEEVHLVNGSLLKKYIGQPVRIFLNVESDGHKILGVSTDDKPINLTMDQHSQQQFAGWVEVFGTPTSEFAIYCSEIIVFPNDSPLDRETHNGIVEVIDNMKDLFENGSSEEEFWLLSARQVNSMSQTSNSQ